LAGTPPKGGIKNSRCEARLPRFLYDYISGGSFQENSLHANIADLQTTLLRQRVMVGESRLNLSIHLWDQVGAAGESGVRDMLDILREDLRAGMILTGCNDVNRATPELLFKD
jgi:isopentenyl diphosphate isomerase/L-lactate dehydrogenase-like FMN-dependent dehydrogenase